MALSGRLLSLPMVDHEPDRDLADLVVALAGRLEETGDPWQPYRLVDADGVPVEPVAAYLKDLQAAGRSQVTLRSYSMDLLRWFRFLWAVECRWDHATRAEARDFSRWVQLAGKVERPHWRHVHGASGDTGAAEPGPMEGATLRGRSYAATTVAHSETVLRGFYDFHRDAGSGPVVNPFPLVRERHRGGRPNAHHNPLQPFRRERAGLYRPKIARRAPRCIPDEKFNELFAGLRSHRDRALVAFFVSTGARAAELLGVMNGDVDAGQQLITVVRKGSRRMQQLPASPDAFVWLRLYQAQMDGLAPSGPDDPLWWTLRRPFRQLSYHAVYQLLGRVAGELGAHWSLHDLRHTAAYRMARDPELPLTDVQWILGHASLTTTQIYINPLPGDVIASVLAHHERRKTGQRAGDAGQGGSLPVTYRQESLDVLFGKRNR